MMETKIEKIASHSEESEKALEKFLVEFVEHCGGKALKYSNPNETGYPDRLVILPGKPVFWVELKSKGKKPRKIQELRHKELRDLGQKVYVVDNRQDIYVAVMANKFLIN